MGLEAHEPGERQALLEARELFENGLYFECHDRLEEVWTGNRGPARDLLQGLIQSSVAFYHLGRGNLRGSRSLMEKALARLALCPAVCCGLELEAHREELRGWKARLDSGTPVSQDELAAKQPHWRLAPARPAAEASAAGRRSGSGTQTG